MADDKSNHYKTADEFAQAARQAFEAALAQQPEDVGLQGIHKKFQEADDARKAYEDLAAPDASAPGSTPGAVAADRDAKMKQREAEEALRKWYSKQWIREPALRPRR